MNIRKPLGVRTCYPLHACYTGAMPNFDRGRSSDDVQAWSISPTWGERLRSRALHLIAGLGIALVLLSALRSYLV